MKSKILIFACVAFLTPSLVNAQSASTDAFKAADARMMKNMDKKPTGDADRDFVAMMIPHHHGAVDMAKIELEYGHDKQLRQLAEKIVRAQKSEIAEMEQWQARHAQ